MSIRFMLFISVVVVIVALVALAGAFLVDNAGGWVAPLFLAAGVSALIAGIIGGVLWRDGRGKAIVFVALIVLATVLTRLVWSGSHHLPNERGGPGTGDVRKDPFIHAR
jgi:hypothetical protein